MFLYCKVLVLGSTMSKRFEPITNAELAIKNSWTMVHPGWGFRHWYLNFINWAEENCEYNWCCRGSTCRIYFSNEADKIKFILKFGSEIYHLYDN